jgi:hypothetical protein
MSNNVEPEDIVLAPLLSRSVDSALPERELRARLVDLTREARTHGLRIEQLLVLLKAASGRGTLRAGDAEERLRQERLVTLCIDAYYAARTA